MPNIWWCQGSKTFLCLIWAWGRQIWTENDHQTFESLNFSQNLRRIAFIMFKPFLEQINGLEKAGTLKVGDQQSLLGSRGLLKVFLGVLSRSRTLQSLFWWCRVELWWFWARYSLRRLENFEFEGFELIFSRGSVVTL